MSVRVPRLGSLLEPSWGPLWAVLGASWAVFGPSGGPLEPSWGGLRGLWGRLGASGSRKSENPKKPSKTIDKSMIFPSLGHLGRPLRGLLRASWAVFELSWTVLRPCEGIFDCSRAVLERSWAALEPSRPSWAPLGAILRPLEGFSEIRQRGFLVRPVPRN